MNPGGNGHSPHPVEGKALRAWRRSRGWDVPEMARQLRRAARDADVPVAGDLPRTIRRWERDGCEMSERYELLYAGLGFPGGMGEARELARQVITAAGTLPGPGDIDAYQAGALNGTADSARREEIRALAVGAKDQMEQLAGKLARLAELIGDEPGGGHG